MDALAVGPPGSSWPLSGRRALLNEGSPPGASPVTISFSPAIYGLSEGERAGRCECN